MYLNLGTCMAPCVSFSSLKSIIKSHISCVPCRLPKRCEMILIHDQRSFNPSSFGKWQLQHYLWGIHNGDFPTLAFLSHPMLSLTRLFLHSSKSPKCFPPFLNEFLNLILFPRQTSILLTFIYFVDMFVWESLCMPWNSQSLVLVFCITLFEAVSHLLFATVWFSRLVGSQASERFSCLCLPSLHGNAGITDRQPQSLAHTWVPGAQTQVTRHAQQVLYK